MDSSVLFVCSANICRSPMAEGLLIDLLAQKRANWKVDSAGVWAETGYPVAANTQLVLREFGVDFHRHRSKPISRDLVKSFNLILVMEQGHQEALKAAFPDHADKVYLLSEMIDRKEDIVDPIGGYLVDFKETADEIQSILRDGFQKITLLASK